MKRYTVCLRPLDRSLTPEKIKSTVERDILHGRAAFYRLGKANQIAPDKVLLEIASKLKPAEVLQYFQEREESLAVRVEQIQWGWSITDSDKPVTGMVIDPYATAQPQSAENASYTYSRWQPIRYVIQIVVNIAILMVVLLIIFTPFREYLISDGHVSSLSWVLLYFIWGYSFFGGRFIPISYIAHIRCAPDYLEIKYGFWRKPKRLAWSEISRLELHLLYSSLGQAVVHAQSTALKFTGTIEHIAQEVTLVKTVIDRAALVFAEDSSSKLIYRRSGSTAE